MLVFWRIRYLDRNDRQFKDRDLYLDTATLDAPKRAAVELFIDSKTYKTEREVLRYRSLFHEEKSERAAKSWYEGQTEIRSVCLIDYFEYENGEECSLRELGVALTGNPDSFVIPRGAEQHDIDFRLAEPTPIPIAEVSLSSDDVNRLGYFTRDMRELRESPFLLDGPGTLKWDSRLSTPEDAPILETSARDAEIRSFVTIFRRLYMANEPANFLKAVSVFASKLGDDRYGKWVAGCGRSYEAYLVGTLDELPFVGHDKWTFTRKRLIDVFLYTQYAHQPEPRRQRQFEKCLGEVGGKVSVLFWLFLNVTHFGALKMKSVDNVISPWFRRYCQYHNVTPDILESIGRTHPGIGSQEKDDDRRARLFREKAEELAMELWKQNDRPEGGPMQFLHAAQAELRKAIGG